MFSDIREFSALAAPAPKKSEIAFGGVVDLGDGSASDNVMSSSFLSCFSLS